MSVMIQTQNLTKTYGKYAAVNDVSLTVEKGDIYGLIGKNGAGKSTLFKVLMGLSDPNGGSITIMGGSSRKGLNEGRKHVGFMIGTNFFAYLSAYDNLEYFRKLKGIVDKNEINRVLKMVDLHGVKKPFKTFSMGMKQRLGIANALMGNPDVVILDEPVNGLDPQGIADFRKLIQRLNREYGITFIVSSHILGELGLMATRFGFIHQGRLVEEITAQGLHEKTRSSLYLGVNDAAQATTLLEEKLQTKQYRVLDQNSILLNEYINESQKVAKVMIENGLDVYQLKINETTLEDYFLNLIGGELHD